MSEKIFVFGSNLAGRHGAGAAKYALKYCGAVYGNPKGRQGFSYAIPTKNEFLKPLKVFEIQEFVDQFIEYAKSNPELKFYITRIGTGLAGFSDKEIAPLFKNCPANCELHPIWLEIIKNCI